MLSRSLQWYPTRIEHLLGKKERKRTAKNCHPCGAARHSLCLGFGTPQCWRYHCGVELQWVNLVRKDLAQHPLPISLPLKIKPPQSKINYYQNTIRSVNLFFKVIKRTTGKNRHEISQQSWHYFTISSKFTYSHLKGKCYCTEKKTFYNLYRSVQDYKRMLLTSSSSSFPFLPSLLIHFYIMLSLRAQFIGTGNCSATWTDALSRTLLKGIKTDFTVVTWLRSLLTYSWTLTQSGSELHSPEIKQKYA